MNYSTKKITLIGGSLFVSTLQKMLLQNGYKTVILLPKNISYKELQFSVAASDLIVGTSQKNKLNYKINSYCLQNKKPWLPYRIDTRRSFIDIGPLVCQADTSCYACYEQRLKENAIIDSSSLTHQKKKKLNNDKKQIEAISILLLVQAINHFFKVKTQPKNEQNTFLTHNFYTGKTNQCQLLQYPLCAYCNKPILDEKIEIKRKKIIYFENGLRTISSEQTWKKAQRFIHHAGLITGLTQQSKPFQDLYTYQAISADPIGNNRFRTHAGKGITLTQNMISATLEGIERYCAKFAMLDPFKKEVFGSYSALKARAVHPSKFQITIGGYADNKKIKWVKSWSLTNNKPCLLPLDYVSLIPIGSNGLASGNCIEEAILHGIFELIERDIYMIMDLHEMVMPDLDMRSIKDKQVIKILKELDDSRTSYSIKYIHTDTNIPTFGMFMKGHVNNEAGYSYAVCSHLNRDIALSRTVTEAIQQYPKLKVGTRWLNKNTAHYHKKSLVSVSMQAIPTYDNKDIKANIIKCQLLLDALHLEIFVVNHSLPGLDFAVVRVLIAGLQPIWFKETPYLVDRVFTLPQKLGFVTKQKNDLNYGQYSGFPYFIK